MISLLMYKEKKYPCGNGTGEYEPDYAKTAVTYLVALGVWKAVEIAIWLFCFLYSHISVTWIR